MLNVATNAVAVPENDFDIVKIEMRFKDLMVSMEQVELQVVKAGLEPHKEFIAGALTEWINLADPSEAKISYEQTCEHCEQVSLRLACFPETDQSRKIGLATANFVKHVFGLGRGQPKKNVDVMYSLVTYGLIDWLFLFGCCSLKVLV